MIIDALFQLLGGMIGALLSLLPLPAAPDMSSMVSTWGTVWNWVGWVNGYFPLSEVLLYCVALSALWVAWHAERAIVWGYHQIWGSD